MIPYLSESTQQLLWQQAVGTDQVEEPTRRRGIHRDSVMMMGGGGGGGTLQALLAELSGLKKPRGFFNRTVRKALGMRPKPPPRYRILVMMASNLPEALDEAMLRPGRIDRIYKVGYPTKDGRIRTYKGYLDKVQHCLTDEDLDKLAVITPYATGAMIKDTVNEALINAIRDGREIITWADIVKAKQLKQHGLADDFRYVEHERHALAIHEACHAVAAHKLREHMVIDVATIERRGTIGGFVASIPPEDRFTHWRSEYETDIQVSLASLAGERLLFEGDNSSGVGGDLRAATQLATMMSGYWGMGSTLASHAVQREFGIMGGGRAPRGGGEGRGRRPGAEAAVGRSRPADRVPPRGVVRQGPDTAGGQPAPGVGGRPRLGDRTSRSPARTWRRSSTERVVRSSMGRATTALGWRIAWSATTPPCSSTGPAASRNSRRSPEVDGVTGRIVGSIAAGSTGWSPAVPLVRPPPSRRRATPGPRPGRPTVADRPADSPRDAAGPSPKGGSGSVAGPPGATRDHRGEMMGSAAYGDPSDRQVVDEDRIRSRHHEDRRDAHRVVPSDPHRDRVADARPWSQRRHLETSPSRHGSCRPGRS